MTLRPFLWSSLDVSVHFDHMFLIIQFLSNLFVSFTTDTTSATEINCVLEIPPTLPLAIHKIEDEIQLPLSFGHLSNNIFNLTPSDLRHRTLLILPQHTCIFGNKSAWTSDYPVLSFIGIWDIEYLVYKFSGRSIYQTLKHMGP